MTIPTFTTIKENTGLESSDSRFSDAVATATDTIHSISLEESEIDTSLVISDNTEPIEEESENIRLLESAIPDKSQDVVEVFQEARKSRSKMPSEHDHDLKTEKSEIKPAINLEQSVALDNPVAEAIEEVVFIEDEEKEAILELLESWSAAWSAQNVTGYLACYSSNFIPAGGLSIDAWQKQRAERLKKPEFVSVNINSVDVKLLTESSGSATFTQKYQSNQYRSNAVKRLSLLKADGKWKIVKEAVLSEVN